MTGHCLMRAPGQTGRSNYILSDAADMGIDAEHLVETTRIVTGKETMSIPMASDGGGDPIHPEGAVTLR